MHCYVHSHNRYVPLSVITRPSERLNRMLVMSVHRCFFDTKWFTCSTPPVTFHPLMCLTSWPNHLRWSLCVSPPPDNDLEPGLSGAGDKEPCADHQSPPRCCLVHVFQYRWKSSCYRLQGQESPPDGVALWNAAAGTAVCTCALVLSSLFL